MCVFNSNTSSSLPGDCWFVAAVACLATTNDKLFDRLVPQDQTFDDGDYAGKHLDT
jgi:hypothetical protein